MEEDEARAGDQEGDTVMDEDLKAQVRQMIEDRMEQYNTPDEVRQTVISNLEERQNDFVEVFIAAVTMWHHLYKYPDTPTLLIPKQCN